MNKQDYREIPYNFTSADDRLIVNHILGSSVWDCLQELRSQRITGRSARLALRFIGDLFIMQRNPFLYQELISSPRRRAHFFRTAATDLGVIEKGIKGGSLSEERSNKVRALIAACRHHLKAFRKELSETKSRRARMHRKLGTIIGKQNILFDPFSLISHATDATDWRSHLPIAIAYPETEEQVAPLLQAIDKLGLHAIPRGAGTGLTGGSVPVRSNCVIINTEKLRTISSPRLLHEDEGGNGLTAVLRVEAGVVTQDAMTTAKDAGFIFATDPTSSWASTIGGNIAENAGGKLAVLWGTAIDNIYSYTMVIPAYGSCTIRRVNHPLRKILPDDTLIFEIGNETGTFSKRIELKGNEIRKPGLWKDITNKALGGLPGLQKEGTDGIITSAEFILHKPYEKQLTFCLEFFGPDMDEASRVIVEISEIFQNNGEEALMALEHFDEEYIKAINYKFKAARSERPKAVLLIDMVAHTDEQLERGRKRFEELLSRYQDTELFTAKDENEAERFWRDRKQLGAISARTNAFKLNEDIVLPLHALAEFARFVEAYNIEEDICNKELFIRKTLSYLKTAVPIEDPAWLEAKLPKADELCRSALEDLECRDSASAPYEERTNKLFKDLLELFQGYKRVGGTIRETFEEVRKKQIIIATHMHAGDGNVHVNIPVFSNDRDMMTRAEITAEEVMKKAVELGGVVSGEHGIGITKMKFLEPKRREELEQHRKTADPRRIMNPGMLEDPEIINKVYTPSFNLLELEAKILQHGSLEKLSNKIAQCVRCGKCKPDCCVFIPSANVFFHPRNKNLAIASLIEAILYDMQRYHFPRYNQLKNLQEIADHCTMCGKCLTPCPVDIDTAEVSILERQILADIGYKKRPFATTLSLSYLKNRGNAKNAFFRKTVLDWGSKAQRLGARMLQSAPDKLRTSSHPMVQMMSSPMVAPSKTTLRDVLPACTGNEALLLRPEETGGQTVFYFPGCGSERLYGDIGQAAVYALLKSGTTVVLPPPFLCCGFPAKVNAKEKMYGEITLRDTIILSQIREMLGYMVFDAVIVSCGTCLESLSKLGCEEIFDCGIKDIASYVTEREKELFTNGLGSFLYHTPCHDSLQGQGASLLADLGASVAPTAYCCSEAGTMAVSRPDISASMRLKKRDSIAMAQQVAGGRASVILTNCPSCISGLGRNTDMGVTPRHIAELLAETAGGPDWRQELTQFVTLAEKVTF